MCIHIYTYIYIYIYICCRECPGGSPVLGVTKTPRFKRWNRTSEGRQVTTTSAYEMYYIILYYIILYCHFIISI